MKTIISGPTGKARPTLPHIPALLTAPTETVVLGDLDNFHVEKGKTVNLRTKFDESRLFISQSLKQALSMRLLVAAEPTVTLAPEPVVQEQAKPVEKKKEVKTKDEDL
jgi:hypothetical protein